MHSYHIFTQPHGLVWFVVFILPADPNLTKPQQKNNTS